MKFIDILKKIMLTIGIVICVAFPITMLFFANISFVIWLFLTIGVGVCLFGILCIIFNVILNKIWGLKNIQFPL